MGWLEIAFSNLSKRIRKTNSRKKLVAENINKKNTQVSNLYVFKDYNSYFIKDCLRLLQVRYNFKMHSYLHPLSNITLSVNSSLLQANPLGK